MTNQLDWLTQTLAGRYRVQRLLGLNGFLVYLAHDLKQNREVVLKVTRDEWLAVTERFLRESTLIGQLEHPHILPLLESGHAGGFFYYIIPHVKAESLRDRLGRERSLPVDDALQITRQVAQALSYAHSHNVVHHDIKPENILLEGGNARLAGWMEGALAAFASGTEGVVVGTPSYLSPEQASGAPNVDLRSEVYSLACVLYEMLIGDPPFVSSNTQTLLAKVTSEIPTSIRRLRPNVPLAVEAALGRALSKLPADRFATALQFAEALVP